MTRKQQEELGELAQAEQRVKEVSNQIEDNYREAKRLWNEAEGLVKNSPWDISVKEKGKSLREQSQNHIEQANYLENNDRPNAQEHLRYVQFKISRLENDIDRATKHKIYLANRKQELEEKLERDLRSIQGDLKQDEWTIEKSKMELEELRRGK
ncbi:hypothetical protein V7024_15970 [Bacillus sp. JJ864]|uniref:hypothetical protein n=1 Tax=Bacillus sp. JJ864 TaxID=3122975 RepID=UPI002FFF57B7